MSKQTWGFWLIFLSIMGLGAQANQSTTILLTEIFYDTPGADGEREWIEIANVGTAVLDLSDIKVGDETVPGGSEGMNRFPDGAKIEPGQVIIVAQTAVGFRELYGRNPNYEINNSDPDVPDMRRYPLWAGGDLALSNNGDDILLIDRLTVIDAVSYGDSRAAFSPAVSGVSTGQSIERIPANCDADSAADWQTQPTPTPGVITLDGTCAAPLNPAEREDLPPIGVIQGESGASPFVNETISFRGVVTGSYEDRNASGVTYYTLFVQDLPGHEDGNPATSDGIALFLGRKRGSYQPGDQLRITGRVTEFFDYTEIDDAGLDISVEAENSPLPAPIAITPPAGSAAQAVYFEPLESMLVSIPAKTRVVGPTYSGCGFAVVRADSSLTRVFRRRAADLSGPIVTILHHSDVRCSNFPNVKVGDTVNGIIGPLIYNFEAFKIVQQAAGALAVTAVPLPDPSPPPQPAANQFSLTTFNVENHFDSVDDTGDDAEPKPSPAEIAIKQTKLAHAIGRTLGCPTLIGIQEVENEGLLLDLARETAVLCGFTYQVTHRESADRRGIDVALLSDPRRVTITAAALRQGCTAIATNIMDDSSACSAGENPLFSRPPLQVDLRVDDVDYTIFVNHFKSKRGGEAETAPRRLAQAQHIVGLVNDLRAQNETVRLIVLGDFNDYELSPPLELMTSGGDLVNALLDVSDQERYSFVFGGVSQLIDGVLLSPNLADAVAAVTIQHTNADFPDTLGSDTSPANLAYKATDHDLPLIVVNIVGGPETAVTPTLPPETAVPPTPAPPSPEPGGGAGSRWLWVLGGIVAVVTVVTAALFRRR